jgi:hypothetical protein
MLGWGSPCSRSTNHCLSCRFTITPLTSFAKAQRRLYPCLMMSLSVGTIGFEQSKFIATKLFVDPDYS